MKNRKLIHSAVAAALLVSCSLQAKDMYVNELLDDHSIQIGINHFWLDSGGGSSKKGYSKSIIVDGNFTKVVKKDPIKKNTGEDKKPKNDVDFNITRDIENSKNITVLEKITKTKDRKIKVSPKIDVLPQVAQSDIEIPAIKPFEKRTIIIPKDPYMPDAVLPKAISFNFDGVSLDPDPASSNTQQETRSSYWRSKKSDDPVSYGEVVEVNLESGTFLKENGIINVKDYSATETASALDSTKSAIARVIEAQTDTINESTNAGGATVVRNFDNSAIDKTPNNKTTPTNIVDVTPYRGIPDGEYAAQNSSGAPANQPIFYTLMNAPYTYFGEDVRIYANDKGGYVMNLETQGKIADNLEKLLENGVFGADKNPDTNELYKTIKHYREYASKASLDNTAKKPTLFFENRGLIEVGDKMNSFLVVTTHTDGEKRINILNNKGKIVFLPGAEFNEPTPANANRPPRSIYYHSPDTNRQTAHIYMNTGEIELYGHENSLFLATASSGSYLKQTEFRFVNDGDIKMVGANNIGVGIDSKELGQNSGFFVLKPISISGDGSVGLYSINDTLTRNNKTYSTMSAVVGDTNAITEYDFVNKDGVVEKKRALANLEGNDNQFVDNSIGIFTKLSTSNSKSDALVKSDITIEKFAKDSIAVNSAGGELVLTPLTDTEHTDFEDRNKEISKGLARDERKHSVTLSGGLRNTGIFALGESANKKAKVTFHGDVRVKESQLADPAGGEVEGRENRALSAASFGTIDFSGNLIVGDDNLKAKNAIGIYTDSGNVNIKNYQGQPNTVVNMDIVSTDPNLDSVIGVYAKRDNDINVAPAGSGEVTFTDVKPKIRVVGKDANGNPTNKGLGMFASNKGKITANKGADIEAVGVATALAAAKGGYINANGSTLTYDGSGYAVYSDGWEDTATGEKSKIDLQNSVINIKGKSAGFGVKYDPVTDTYNLQGVDISNSQITAHSKDVVIFTVSNLPEKSTSEFNTEAIFGTLGRDYTIARAPGAEQARLASIEGLPQYKIDTDIHKELAGARGNSFAAMQTDAEKIAFNFARNIIAQRAKVILEAGKQLTAHLDTNMLRNLDMPMTSGIDVSSSTLARSKDETAITLKGGSLVSVDRIDTDENGGVGLFVNYGKINIEQDSSVKVEKSGLNAPNKNAIGVYGVGTDVTNDGSIEVGGADSIGILSNAYKISDSFGTIVYNEFGEQADSGTANIVNNNKIIMDGENSTGIYVNNNSVDIPAPGTPRTNLQNQATNNGEITLNGKRSSGMVASNSSITNTQAGVITLKAGNSAGMYGNEQIRPNTNEANKISNAGKIVLEGENSIGMIDKNINTASKVTLEATGQITSTANSNTAIQGTNIDVVAGSKIALKDKSFGIYAYDNANVSVGNLQEFELGKNSVYVALKNSKSANDTNDRDVTLHYNHQTPLNVKENSVGILAKKGQDVAVSRTKITMVSGGFNLGDNAIGIYSDDTKSDIVVSDAVKVKSVGNSVFGIYSEGGKIENKAKMDLSKDKNGAVSIGNIGIFAKGEADIKNEGDIILGKSDEDREKYAIGIGLQGSGNLKNTANIKLTEQNAVGIYVDGANSVAENTGVIDIEATAVGSIGVFANNGATFINRGDINVKAKDAIGVFLKGSSVLKNYGNFNVTGENAYSVMIDESGNKILTKADDPNINEIPDSSIEHTTTTVTFTQLVKALGDSSINLGQNGEIQITNNGQQVSPTEIAYVNTPNPVVPVTNVDLTINNTTSQLNPANFGFNDPASKVDGINMYVDTSGVQATNPINGLANLGTNLPKMNIFIGAEAAKYTDSKYIVVKKEIIQPFIDAVANANPENTNFVSGSLTWEANIAYNDNAQNFSDKFESFVLTKKPYRDVGNNTNLNPIYNGLDDKYSNRTTSGEDRIFNIINDLGRAERDAFNEAVSQMAGSEYANTQERVKSSADIYNREFYEVMEWDTNTTDTTKFKLFGERARAKFKPNGYVDYNKKSKGIFVLHTKDLDVAGNSHGVFAGVAKEGYDFKNQGQSKEKATTAHLGYYIDTQLGNSDTKWLSKASLNYGVRKMDRKFIVVNEQFNAKGRYVTYGAEWDNKFYQSYDFDNGFRLKPYAGVELSYSHIKDVKEKGDIALDIDMKRYYGVKPNAGVEVKFNKPLDETSRIAVGLDTKVFYEAGKIYPAQNGSRISNTNTAYYKLDRDRNGFGAEVTGGVTYEDKGFGASIKAGGNTRNKNGMIGLDLRLKF